MTLTSIKLCVLILPLCLASAVQAQLYKSVGPDGKVTYSDTPPHANQKIIETKSMAVSQDVANFPYELKLAASKNPVVVYTTSNCKPCNDGQKFLKSAGIPFSEKTVTSNADSEKLKQISGDLQLPLMTIGSKKFQGYNHDDWQAAINSAGYPDSNRLPATYVYPTAESAVPVSKPDPAAVSKKDVTDPAPATTPIKKPENNNGFRF